MPKPRLSTKLPLTAAGGLPKADVLERWRSLPAGKQLNPEAAPYGARGGGYERDSIRVTGSLKFLDAAMSSLKGLLRHENIKTRLDISFAEQTEKRSTKRVKGKYVLYVTLKEKARTTRAGTTPARTRSPAAPSLARQPVGPAPAAAGPQTEQMADALRGLGTLGYKPQEAERRLKAVVERHGRDLDSAAYLKLVLSAK